MHVKPILALKESPLLFLLHSAHLAPPVVDLEAVSSDPGEQGERRRRGLEVDRGPGAYDTADATATETTNRADSTLDRYAGSSSDAPGGGCDPRRCRSGLIPRYSRRRGTAEHH